MPLFARRTLQRVLNENAVFIAPERIVEIAGLSNTARDDYLSIEWEQVIINCASKFGSVQHEPKLGGSKVDMLFGSNEHHFEFIADITVPSDEGFHKLNPVDAFNEEFWRRVWKSNWHSGGFDIHVDPLTKTIYKGMRGRIRLKLPERNKWNSEIFNSRFSTFLNDIQRQPEQHHEFDAVSPSTGVHIKYDPKRRGSSGGSYLAYTLATALDQNPVYNALKKKSDQIKRARYDGIAGIFMCDGSCEMISSSPSVSSYSVDEVIHHFFLHVGSVWFVAVFSVKQTNSQISVQTKLYLNPKRGGTDFSHLKEVVDNIRKSLPALQRHPYNARLRAKDKDLSGRYYGHLTGGNVKMSAREMLEILAGVKTVAEFEKNYSLTPNTNPFRLMLERGRLITKVTVENLPEKDDDEVKFEFGNPDAAVAAFRASPDKRK
jgi:hypothetical protein